MSKFSKLVKKPNLFFKDMIEKKQRQKLNNTIKKETSSKQVPKISSKPINKEQNISFKISKNINIFAKNYLILHTGEKYNALSHIKIWHPYFLASKANFIVLTRFIPMYDLLVKEFPESIIIFAKGQKEIDKIFDNLCFIKACFYPSNTGNNLHLMHRTNIKHIFIGHGDSDKSASAHKFFRVYDENWVAGQAHIDRFVNKGFKLNGLKQIKVGRPSLYENINNKLVSWRNRFNGEFNLLYLPTWEGILKEQDYSSLSIIEHVLESISYGNDKDVLNISIKLHPLTGQREKKYINIEKNFNEDISLNFIPKTETLNEYIKTSNIFICDISAVVSECLAQNGPIFLYMPQDKNINILESNMQYKDYCYVYSNPEQLEDLIHKIIIENNDYLEKKRKKAAKYIIGTKETKKKTFIKKLSHLGGIDD